MNVNTFYSFIVKVKVFYLLIETFANKLEFLKAVGYLKFVVKWVSFFNLDTFLCIYFADIYFYFLILSLHC